MSRKNLLFSALAFLFLCSAAAGQGGDRPKGQFAISFASGSASGTTSIRLVMQYQAPSDAEVREIEAKLNLPSGTRPEDAADLLEQHLVANHGVHADDIISPGSSVGIVGTSSGQVEVTDGSGLKVDGTHTPGTSFTAGAIGSGHGIAVTLRPHRALLPGFQSSEGAISFALHGLDSSGRPTFDRTTIPVFPGLNRAQLGSWLLRELHHQGWRVLRTRKGELVLRAGPTVEVPQAVFASTSGAPGVSVTGVGAQQREEQ